MLNKKPLYIFALYFVLYEVTTYLSNDMIMPAMPEIVHEFHASLENVALSLSFFIIGGSVLQIFLGPLADVIGKRKVLLFGNLLFLVATLIIPMSSTIDQFLAARFFQGMGMCFIFIGYAMIHELFNDVDAVKLMSALVNISVFAPLAGPIIGSAITSVSKWQFIFIISGVLGAISFAGLYKYMPQGKIHADKVNISEIIKSYKVIFTHRIFMYGMMCSVLSMTALISWIGISPAIILENQHRSFTAYVIYQGVIFGGFAISNILINKLAGKFSFYTLINYGGRIGIAGLLIAGILCWTNTYIIVLGMSIYAFGLGLYNGSLIRISLSSTGESMNLSSSAMSLINSAGLSASLALFNKITHVFNYSIESYALINLVISIPMFFMLRKFALMNKSREWNVAQNH